MLLILDQGVPFDAAVALREFGFSCTHVAELEMSKAEDGEILAWASDKNAVVVTFDADFHMLLAVSGALKPSVIRFRMQGIGAEAVVAIVRSALSVFEGDLENGALVTIKAKKTTCHRLPIGIERQVG